MINIGNVLSVRVPTLIHSALWQLGTATCISHDMLNIDREPATIPSSSGVSLALEGEQCSLAWTASRDAFDFRRPNIPRCVENVSVNGVGDHKSCYYAGSSLKKSASVGTLLAAEFICHRE
jgi:hypothetical protein